MKVLYFVLTGVLMMAGLASFLIAAIAFLTHYLRFWEAVYDPYAWWAGGGLIVYLTGKILYQYYLKR